MGGKGKVDADILEIEADSAPLVGSCQVGETGGGRPREQIRNEMLFLINSVFLL